jgi:hypothetical protein
MAEVSGIHVLPQASRDDVDGWAKPSHDECDGLVSLIERWYYGATVAAVRARCSRPSDGPTSDPNRHGWRDFFSGRAGGERRRSRRCRGPRGVRIVAEVVVEQPLAQPVEEACEAAAVGDDGVAEFVPERPIAVAGPDAEVAADVDDDGADRATTHFGGDLFFRGEAREGSVRAGSRGGVLPACAYAPA